MLLLIVSDNLLILFFGWEGVGICSYLLISFWFTRIQANKSALKAVFVNRVSDFLLMFGFLITFNYILNLEFSTVFALCSFIDNSSFWIFNSQFYILTMVSFFYFLGAVGKSAQIILHTWLPDAMEGPTPVSALIHAATMVTAGVFLLIRVSFIIEYSLQMLSIIAYIGVFTSIFAATSGLMLLDIKKVIAYSTCSQLGYMIFSCGLSAYNISLFHLMNHAFFKALLFLGAGAIIHSLNNEQDMRKMGNLFRVLPLSYNALLIGSLAITGFPFLTGFYSKDILLETATVIFGSVGFFVQWIAFFTAFFTAFYSFKIIFLVFFNKSNFLRNSFFLIHESPFEIAIVLILLVFGSIFCGYFFKDIVVGFGSLFLSNSIFVLLKNIASTDFEFIFISIKLIPFFLGFFGIFFYLVFVFFLRKSLFFYTKIFNSIFKFLLYQWYFNKIYNNYINLPFLRIAKMWTYKLLDKGLFEVFGPQGIWSLLKTIKNNLKILESGNISFYSFLFIFPLFFLFYIFCCDFFFLGSTFLVFFISFQKNMQYFFEKIKQNKICLLLKVFIWYKCIKTPMQDIKDQYRNIPKKHYGHAKFKDCVTHFITIFIIIWISFFECLLEEYGISLQIRTHLKIIYFDIYWCLVFYYAWWRLNVHYVPTLRKLYTWFKITPYFIEIPFWLYYFTKVLSFIERVFFFWVCGFFYYLMFKYKMYISSKLQRSVIHICLYLNLIFLVTQITFLF
jgi:proton-translocating NADH-quinone oxidoreductase chain L